MTAVAARIGGVGTATLAAGAALGVIYTLSPLTVLSGTVLGWVVWRAARDLTATERQWFFFLIGTAIVLRLAAIAGLLLFADEGQPYATFFGDELLFKSRTVWLRNIGLSIPISRADMIYVYDDTGRSSYLFILAFIQALVGDAPYGTHVLNATVYLTGCLIMYRLVRPSFGGVAATGGLAVLLFLPSLFAWSISALKEPLNVLVAAVEVYCAVEIVRTPTWRRKALAAMAVVVLAYAMESLRTGQMLVVIVGTIGGLALGALLPRPRWLLASLLIVPIVAGVALTQPRVRDMALLALRTGAFYHSGHVLTEGQSYELIDAKYYNDRELIWQMPAGEAALFAGKAAAAYVVEPVPWTVESKTALAYLPEQMIWLLLLALVPVGFVAAVRREPATACLLMAHGLAAALIVALASGNIGTLIRHRGLALPYLAWFAVLGLCTVLATASSRPHSQEMNAHGTSR